MMKLNDLNTLLIKAKTKLMREHPFFGTLIAQMPLIMAPEIPTAATDGEKIWVNPEFIRGMKLPPLMGLLAHETLHAAFLHMFRVHNRDHFMWNVAADYAINLLIKEQGMTLPEGALLDSRFKNMSAETIYEKLMSESDLQKKHRREQFGDGVGEDLKSPAVIDKATQKARENTAKQNLAAARQAAKKAGKYAGGLERIIEELLIAKISWQEYLNIFATEKAYDDYSWSRPNRRFIGDDVFLPTLHSEALPPMVICVDTSGSIDQKILNEFAAEINGIRENCRPKKTFIAYVDTAIRKIEVLDSGDTWEPKPEGGGGTDFSRVWDPLLDSEELEGIIPCAAVFFTDMHVWGWGDEPEFPVLWVDWNNGTTNPPYGEVIRIPS